MSEGPWFGPADRQAVADFCAVYDRHYAEIQAETLKYAREDAQFGPLVGAIESGDWTAYETNLRVSGKLYAGMGIDFDRWYDLIGGYQALLLPRLVQAYATEPPRLSAALLAAQRFIDRALSIIGQSYL